MSGVDAKAFFYQANLLPAAPEHVALGPLTVPSILSPQLALPPSSHQDAILAVTVTFSVLYCEDNDTGLSTAAVIP
jgi:hypothetical protein